MPDGSWAVIGFRSVRIRFGSTMGVMLGESWTDTGRETASHLHKHNGPQHSAGGRSHGLCQVASVCPSVGRPRRASPSMRWLPAPAVRLPRRCGGSARAARPYCCGPSSRPRRSRKRLRTGAAIRSSAAWSGACSTPPPPWTAPRARFAGISTRRTGTRAPHAGEQQAGAQAPHTVVLDVPPQLARDIGRQGTARPGASSSRALMCRRCSALSLPDSVAPSSAIWKLPHFLGTAPGVLDLLARAAPDDVVDDGPVHHFGEGPNPDARAPCLGPPGHVGGTEAYGWATACSRVIPLSEDARPLWRIVRRYAASWVRPCPRDRRCSSNERRNRPSA